MHHGQMVLVACTIEAGAFSGERVVRIEPLGGSGGDYAGIAPARSCFVSTFETVGRDRPVAGQSISGFVEAFVVSNGGDQAMVELPDGETIRVKISQVPAVRERGQELKYVPV